MMKKRTFAFLLATVCMLSFTVAAYAAVPSKTTGGMTSAESYVEPGAQVPHITVTIVQNTPAVTAQLEKLQAHVAAGGSPASFFGDLDIASKLPEGINVEDLEINEFIAATITDYIDEGLEEIIVSFAFATVYREGQAVVAVVGVFDAAGNVTWYVLEAKVENGNVLITFPTEFIKTLGDQPFAIAILSQK